MSRNGVVSRVISWRTKFKLPRARLTKFSAWEYYGGYHTSECGGELDKPLAYPLLYLAGAFIPIAVVFGVYMRCRRVCWPVLFSAESWLPVSFQRAEKCIIRYVGRKDASLVQPPLDSSPKIAVLRIKGHLCFLAYRDRKSLWVTFNFLPT